MTTDNAKVTDDVKDNSSGKVVSDNLDSVRQFAQNDWKTMEQSRQASSTAADVLTSTNLTLTDNKNNDVSDAVKGKDNPLAGLESDKSNLKELMDIYRTTDKMNSKIDKDLSKEDQKTMRELNEAIASGDSKAIGKALERFKGDPAGLKRFMTEYNNVLRESGSGLQATTQGETVTFHTGNGRGVQVSTDGRASVRQVTTHENGPQIMGPQLHDANPAAEMRTLGSQVRFNTKLEPIAEPPKDPIFEIPNEPWPGDRRPARRN